MASLEAILGVLKGTPAPTSQPGAEHVSTSSVIVEMMWGSSAQSDQLQLGGQLTLGLPSFFTSGEFAHNQE